MSKPGARRRPRGSMILLLTALVMACVLGAFSTSTHGYTCELCGQHWNTNRFQVCRVTIGKWGGAHAATDHVATYCGGGYSRLTHMFPRSLPACGAHMECEPASRLRRQAELVRRVATARSLDADAGADTDADAG